MTTGLTFENSAPTIWPRCKWQRCNFFHQDPEVVADHEAVCNRRVVAPTYEQRRAKVQRNRRRQETNVGRPLGGEVQRDNRDIDDLLASIETPGAAVPAVLPPRLIQVRQLKVLRRPRVVVARVRAILRQRRAAVLPPDSISPLLDSPSSPPASVSTPLDIATCNTSSGFHPSHGITSQSPRVIDSGSFHRSPTPLPPVSVSAPLDIATSSGFHHSALPIDSGSFHRSPTPFRAPSRPISSPLATLQVAHPPAALSSTRAGSASAAGRGFIDRGAQQPAALSSTRAGYLGERPRWVRGSAPPISSSPLATLQVRDEGVRLACAAGRGFIGSGAQPPATLSSTRAGCVATLQARDDGIRLAGPGRGFIGYSWIRGAQPPVVAHLPAPPAPRAPPVVAHLPAPPAPRVPLPLPAPRVPPGFHDRPRLPVPQFRLQPLPAPRVPPGFHDRLLLPVPQFRLQPLPAPRVPPGFLDRPPTGFQPPPPGS